MKLLSIILILASSGTAFALQCGDSVSGNVTLNADLVCVNQSGLTVSADNTFIHLNGHSIVCTGAGFAGSCQDPVGGPILGLPVGIFSNNHDHVVVEGPGIIGGFGFGVELEGGKGLSVHQVSISGPAVPLIQNQRGTAVGIFMRNIACRDNSPFAPEHGTSATVYANTVQNQVTGILLAFANCVEVYGNHTLNNNGAGGNGHGIAITGGGHNSIYRNTVTGNGLNRMFDAGIYLTYDVMNNTIEPTTHNIVFSNVVNNNCGDGIEIGSNGNNNNVFANTAKFNGIGSNDGRCDLPRTELAFYDLAQIGGMGNIWNPNNLCHTQNAQIPAGVCNPNE